MKTSLNIFLLFLILCASCGSRKANDNKETAVQARHRKKIHAPPYTSHAEHSRIACGLSGTALLGQYGFYRYHLYQPSGCYGTSMGGLYRYPEDSAGHYCR